MSMCVYMYIVVYIYINMYINLNAPYTVSLLQGSQGTTRKRVAIVGGDYHASTWYKLQKW